MTDYLDFSTLTRPPKPNNYLLAPPGLCQAAEPNAASPKFSETPRHVFSRLSEIISSERQWIDVRSDPDKLRIAFIARTPLMRFKDDVDIQILPPEGDSGETQIAIYSRSRIGYSDLGANRKRVAELVHKLTAN